MTTPSLLRRLRAAMIEKPATDTVAIYFDHDGDSFDAVQRMLDLVELAEWGERVQRAHRRGAEETNKKRSVADTRRAVRRAAAYYRQCNDGDDDGLMPMLRQRYGEGTEFNLKPWTIRRYLREK